MLMIIFADVKSFVPLMALLFTHTHTITLSAPKRNSPKYSFVTPFQTKNNLLALFRDLGTLTLLVSLCIQKSILKLLHVFVRKTRVCIPPTNFLIGAFKIVFPCSPSGHPTNKIPNQLNLFANIQLGGG